jgi:chemotaxis protein CheD
MMKREDSLLEKIYLKPGELVIAEEPVMVTTVLGSCISVTMFHPGTGAATICHGMLPSGGKSNSFKYVDSSVRHMVSFFDRLKISREELQVKLFGGADMFSCTQQSVRSLTVGWQNITVANRCLEEYGLMPTASDVGGKKGRKLIFKTDSGVVFIKKMSGQDRIPTV